MTEIHAATLWVGLHVLFMGYLKARVGATRNSTKINFGDGDNEKMQRALRVQGNAVEDVPTILIGIVMLAFVSAPLWFIHACGGVLLVSRMLHAFGLARSSGTTFGRMVGTIGSMLALIAVAGGCIYFAFQ
ncbi:MAG: MAPEG family protein [Hyphomonadaceae bacterium]